MQRRVLQLMQSTLALKTHCHAQHCDSGLPLRQQKPKTCCYQLVSHLDCGSLRWLTGANQSDANGKAQHWHIASGRCLHTIDEVDNQIYAVDYKQDGSAFATAGKDKTVRIYDEATKSCMVAMSSGTAKVTPGHSNRIFSVKFHPEDPNLVLSGGWDNTVQVSDLFLPQREMNEHAP